MFVCVLINLLHAYDHFYLRVVLGGESVTLLRNLLQ